MYSHFDTENFEASITKYFVDMFVGYPVVFDEYAIDYDTMTNWIFIEFLGNNGQIVTMPPINHIVVHLRSRGEDADMDMTEMTRMAITNLKDKMFDLYDLDDDVIVGKLRSVIIREFPKETARQANTIRGFNRDILIQVTYGKVGVAYTAFL